MAEHVERRLRALVAEQLGVGEHELEANASLRDDLAVDSLDLVEVAVAIEEAWDVTLPDRLLAQVRTYGELASATVDLVLRRRRKAPRHARPFEAVSVRARILPPLGSTRAALERTAMLTPYTIESLGEDTLRAGPGAQLQLTLSAHCDAAAVYKVRDRFAWLGERHIEVRVSRARVPAQLDVQARLDALEA